MAVPRIGNPHRPPLSPSRPVVVYDRPRRDPIQRALARGPEPEAPRHETKRQWKQRREQIEREAQSLTEQLRPVPGALDEIATRIRRHCASTAKDEALAALCDQLRERTFDLWRAVWKLAEPERAGRRG